ncbi:hypothetical protein [Enterococcus sp. AZ072]|uniref:hypothetical protein n=1 Tax=unclassified Enterococcus TaxID=2608891 RepID=UPI003D2AEED2
MSKLVANYTNSQGKVQHWTLDLTATIGKSNDHLDERPKPAKNAGVTKGRYLFSTKSVESFDPSIPESWPKEMSHAAFSPIVRTDESSTTPEELVEDMQNELATNSPSCKIISFPQKP